MEDAWDEVSVGASLGYQQQINQLLARVRTQYLDNSTRNSCVRVIICGRPSNAIADADFLSSKTRILTVRPLSPAQFEKLVQRVGIAAKNQPLPLDDWAPWSLADVEGQIPQLFERYKKHFEGSNEDESRPTNSTLEILGLPLLAQLALRLMANWKADLNQILDNTTVLYRSLVDLVIDGGKPPETAVETQHSAQLRGREHRELLRKTAEAITLIGQENITYEELDLRLDKRGINLDDAVERDGDNLLSKLMISFFFKGGLKSLGCEFSHKSFREYLFAEQIVEFLKEFGRGTESFAQRGEYWRDFEESDARFGLSRQLAQALGPKWLTNEVGQHITQLIQWEVQRTYDEDPYPNVGAATEPLNRAQWERARDGLADLWDWWGEGVPLRPQVIVISHTSPNRFGSSTVSDRFKLGWGGRLSRWPRLL